MTDQERIARLEANTETQMGIIAGLHSVIVSLVRSHHDIDHLKTIAVAAIELSEVGSIGRVLTEKQRRLAREVAEKALRTAPTH